MNIQQHGCAGVHPGPKRLAARIQGLIPGNYNQREREGLLLLRIHEDGGGNGGSGGGVPGGGCVNPHIAVATQRRKGHAAISAQGAGRRGQFTVSVLLVLRFLETVTKTRYRVAEGHKGRIRPLHSQEGRLQSSQRLGPWLGGACLWSARGCMSICPGIVG